MNKMILRGVALAMGLAAMTGAHARPDVRDGNAIVNAVRGNKYSIDGATMGKAELFGYISDLKDREHLTGLLIKGAVSSEQRQSIASIARTLQLKAFEQGDAGLQSIDLPSAAPVPAAPPIDGAAADDSSAGSPLPGA